MNNIFTRLFSPSVLHSPSPSPQAEGNAAYTFVGKNGDPERNVYATQTGGVVAISKNAAQQSLHKHRTFMQQLQGSTAVVARDPMALRPMIDTSEIDYDIPYHEGVQALKKELKKQGMKFPSELSSLPYGAREALKNVKTSVHNLQKADPDPTLKNMGYLERKSRERFEKGLAIDKRIIDHAKDKLTGDARKLQLLFYVENNKVMPNRDMQSLKNFFQRNFKVSLEKNEVRRLEAEYRHAGTDSERQQAVSSYRSALLRKLPWGAPGNNLPAGRSTYEMAEAMMQERAHQTAIANDLHGDEARLTINGGSLFLEKGGEGDGFAFRLRQAYGQHEYQPVSYELRFHLPEGSRHHEMQLLRISEQGESTSIPLSNDLAEARAVLDRHMNATDLSRLFTDHTELGRSGFAELYGEYKAQQTLMAEVRKTVHRPLKEALIAEVGDRNITSVQMTGFSYNYGHYGENLAVNDRGVMMGLMHELAGEGKLAIVASCGGHQDLLYNIGGVHIGNIPDMLNKTYLSDRRHGNDPFTVEEKQSGAAIQPDTLSAAIFEKPIGQTEDDPSRLRGATLQTPIAQHRKFALEGSEDTQAGAATSHATWAPRDAAPLSLPLLSLVPDYHPETRQPILDDSGQPVMSMEIRPFTFHHNSRPVMASGNLKLASGIDAGGNQVDLDEREGLPDANELATWQRIELKHELPEGYCLKDDEGRNILDEDGAPVRLLEKIVIVPQTASKEEYKMEADENGKPQPIWLDANGTRVFPRYEVDKLPTFFGADGNPAVGKIKLERETKPAIEFRIDGIERWVRVPLSVAGDKDKAKLDKDERILCTYEKREQSLEQQNLDIAILRDPMYTRINCVHSQNGINTPWDQPASAVEMTGSAVKPNDVQGGRRHLLGVSLENPSPHPIAANPYQPKESYINETAQNTLGHGASTLSHQPHSDMLKEDGGRDEAGNPIAANPYSVGKLSKEISPEFRGQDQGNKEGVLIGMQLRNLRATFAELRTASESEFAKEAAKKEAMLDYLDNVEVMRFSTDGEAVLAELRGQAHPASGPLAAKIAEIKAFFDAQPKITLDDLNQAITNYRRSLDEEARNPANDDELQAMMSRRLATINNIGTIEDWNSARPEMTDNSPYARITNIVEELSVLKPDALDFNMRAPMECFQAMNFLRSLARTASAPLEAQHEIETAILRTRRSVAEIELVDLRPSDITDASRLENLQARNTALYNRFRRDPSQSFEHATSEQLAYELLARQDYGPDEKDQAMADKTALAKTLQTRRDGQASMPKEERELIDTVLAVWKDLLERAELPTAPGARQPDTSRLPANAGKVARSLPAIPDEDEQALQELNHAIFLQDLIKTVFNGQSFENHDEWRAQAGPALEQAGLLDHLGETSEARIANFNDQLSHPGAIQQMSEGIELANKQAVIESLMSQMAELNEMVRSYGETLTTAAPAGPQRRFRSVGLRGWELGTGVSATVGTSGPVNSALNAIREAAGNISASAEQAFTALTTADTGLFGATLFLAGLEGSKNAAYGKQRVDRTIPSYEQRRQELEALKTSLQESISAIQKTLGSADAGSAQDAGPDMEKIGKLGEVIDERLNAVSDRLKVLHQASHAHAFNLATNPLLSLAAASGMATTVAGLAGVATATGPVGGSLLAGFGAAGAVRSARELLKDRAITPEITKAGRGIDSGIRRRLNVALENRRNGLKWDIGAKSTLAAGGVMTAVGAGLLPTPAAPAGAVLVAIGGTLIFGGAAGSYLPPRREWRGLTTLAAEDTTLLKGGFLTTSFRRNRALYHLAGKSGIVTELINKISDRALQANDLPEGKQFRQTFKSTRKLRWLAPDIHRKELAKVIASHPSETKDMQFMFMYHTNLHERDWLETYIDQQSAELANVTAALTELKRSGGTGSGASEANPGLKTLQDQLTAHARELAMDLNRVQTRYQACDDLHQKLTAYQPELGRKFRDDTKAQFDDLRIRYMIVHDVVADTMSRKEAAAMVLAHEVSTTDGPRVLTARIGDQTYDGPRMANSNPIGKLSNVEFIYSDASVDFIKRQFDEGRGGGLENSCANMIVYSLPDKWNYEMQGVLHLDIQTMREKAKGETATATVQKSQTPAGQQDDPKPGARPKRKLRKPESTESERSVQAEGAARNAAKSTSLRSTRTVGSMAGRREQSALSATSPAAPDPTVTMG